MNTSRLSSFLSRFRKNRRWVSLARLALTVSLPWASVQAQEVSMTPGTVTTVAGNGGTPASGSIDGNGMSATSATLGQPYYVAADGQGNFYFSDSTSVVRKVTGSTGIISTIAGTGTAGYGGDGGPGTSAVINNARGLCATGAGDVYIADSGNNRLRLYYNGGTTAHSLLTNLGYASPTSGTIYLIAGSSTAGTPTAANGDGGSASAALLNSPRGCTFDGLGNIFVADTGDLKIRKITISTGKISTIVGNGTTTLVEGALPTATGMAVPGDVAISPSGDLFYTEQTLFKIRVYYNGGTVALSQLTAEGVTPSVGHVYSIAGSGTAGVSIWKNGDGQLASTANFNVPRGVTITNSRDLYIADTGDFRVRRMDHGALMVAESGGYSAGTMAGPNGDGGNADAALLNQPYKVAVDKASYYVADYGTRRIRFVNVALSTMAFGAQVIGNSSLVKSVTITNSSSTTLNISSILLPTTYSLITGSGQCASGTSLVGGASCRMSVIFTPSSAGTYSGQVQILSNATNGSSIVNGVITNPGTAIVNVSGTGVASSASATDLHVDTAFSVTGQNVTLRADVAAAAPNGAANGTVTFKDGSTALATVALSSTGTALYTTSFSTAATHPLTAVYSGNGGLSGSTSPVVGEVVRASTSFAIPGPPGSMSSYQLKFVQDFTTMSTLSDLGVNGTSIGANDHWYSHTARLANGALDDGPYINSSGNYVPFSVDNDVLTIRASINGTCPSKGCTGGFSSGVLSSMDHSGNGFAQKYGYFEASIWCPPGANSFPGFYLLDTAALLGTATDEAEIDILEQYGNYKYNSPTDPNGPDYIHLTWYDHNLATHTDDGVGRAKLLQPGLTAGFHLFGVDVEPDYITWYYDRHVVWQVPSYTQAQRPLYVLLDLNLGGQSFNNSNNTAYDWTKTPNPLDLRVQYVAVWASPNSPNYVP